MCGRDHCGPCGLKHEALNRHFKKPSAWSESCLMLPPNQVVCEIAICQKRPFLSLTAWSPESLKILVPQTLGKTSIDFVTFLAASLRSRHSRYAQHPSKWALNRPSPRWSRRAGLGFCKELHDICNDSTRP